MRILHLASEYPPQAVYGLGRYVNEIAEAQAARGNRVEVITNSLRGNDHESIRNGVLVHRVHFPPPPKAPSTSAMLLHFNLQILERFAAYDARLMSFDVINAHDWLTVPAGFHIARIAKCPLVTTIHDVVFNKVNGREFTDEDSYVAGIENWALNVSARSIVLSQTVRQEVLEAYHASPDRIAVVPGGVGIEPLERRALLNLARWRHSWVADDEDLLLYVGRLEPEKGLATLLEGAKTLSDIRKVGWRLVIVGTGRLTDFVQNTIREKGLVDKIQLAGYMPFEQLRLAYTAADVTIVPSDYEPFGLVALESQRMGTPVIVSNTGGLAETLAATEGGIAFPKGDGRRLAECIEVMLGDAILRAELARRGQGRVSELYSWPRIVQQTDALYASVLGGPPPPCLETPPWVFPGSSKASHVERHRHDKPRHERIVDLAVFWNGFRISELTSILNMLLNSQALSSLNGVIRVVPSVAKPQNAIVPPLRHSDPRVIFVETEQQEDVGALLKECAAAVADITIAEEFKHSKWIDETRIPVIWYGAPRKPGKPFSTNDPRELYALSTKLLCDELMRKQLAKNIENPISQVRYHKTLRHKFQVWHVLPQLVTGGAETTLLELVKGTSHAADHAVISLGPINGPLPYELNQIGVSINDMSKASTHELLAFIETGTADLLHLHSLSYVPQWILAHRHLAEFPVIETEHVVNIGSGHFGHVDYTVCVSEAALAAHKHYESVLDGFAKFELIYNGIALEDFENLPSKQEMRTKLGIPTDRVVIGRVSALSRNKLPCEALEAIPLILSKIPNALFVIVGDGPQRPEAEAWCMKKGLSQAVKFIGERRDVPSVLRAMDVFAYYTNKDSFGNVILEAVAAGIPVVTTNVEGTSEALGSAPGDLTPLGDLESFAAKVAHWTTCKRDELAYRIPERFTRRSMAQRYLELYDRVMREHSPKD